MTHETPQPGQQAGATILTRGESLLTLDEAAKLLPLVNGKRHCVNSIWRWCRRGIRGVRLEHVWVGRNLLTSREALGRFFVALAQVELPVQERPVRTKKRLPARPAARLKAIEEAERILREAGV